MKVNGPHTFDQANDLCSRYASLIGIAEYRKGVFRRTVSWLLPAPYDEYDRYISYAYFPDADAGENMSEALREWGTIAAYDVAVLMDYDEDVDEYLFEHCRLSTFLRRHPECLLPGDHLCDDTAEKAS